MKVEIKIEGKDGLNTLLLNNYDDDDNTIELVIFENEQDELLRAVRVGVEQLRMALRKVSAK